MSQARRSAVAMSGRIPSPRDSFSANLIGNKLFVSFHFPSFSPYLTVANTVNRSCLLMGVCLTAAGVRRVCGHELLQRPLHLRPDDARLGGTSRQRRPPLGSPGCVSHTQTHTQTPIWIAWLTPLQGTRRWCAGRTYTSSAATRASSAWTTRCTSSIRPPSPSAASTCRAPPRRVPSTCASASASICSSSAACLVEASATCASSSSSVCLSFFLSICLFSILFSIPSLASTSLMLCSSFG